MTRFVHLTGGGKTTFVALFVAAVAFVMLETAGLTDTPPIPPGLVAIVTAAGLVVVIPGRWTAVSGAVAGLFNLIVMFAVGAEERLIQPKSIVDLVGGWILVVALVVASVGGTVAAVRNNESDAVDKPRDET